MTLVQVERIEINEIDAALSFTGTNTDIADVHIVLIGVLERVENLDVAWLLLLCVMPLGYLGLVWRIEELFYSALLDFFYSSNLVLGDWLQFPNFFLQPAPQLIVHPRRHDPGLNMLLPQFFFFVYFFLEFEDNKHNIDEADESQHEIVNRFGHEWGMRRLGSTHSVWLVSDQ